MGQPCGLGLAGGCFPGCCPRSIRLLRALAQSRVPISTTPVRPLLAMKACQVALLSMVWARTFAMTRLGKYEEWGEVTRWASVCKNERKLGSRGLPQPFLPRNYRARWHRRPPPMAQIVRLTCLSQGPLRASCFSFHDLLACGTGTGECLR